MPVVVDGSNLGGALGGRRGARDAPAVVRLLLGWARGRRHTVVVFDGPPDASLAERYGNLTLRWSAGRSADDEILRCLAKRPRDWTVVTDDRELAERCRRLGAAWRSVSELLAALPAAGSADRDADRPVDIADWEAWFAGAGSRDTVE